MIERFGRAKREKPRPGRRGGRRRGRHDDIMRYPMRKEKRRERII